MARGPRGCLLRPALLVAGALLLAPANALGWGNSGHAQIAQVAWTRLDPVTRTSIVRTLESHPRFEEDFASRMPRRVAAGADRERWIFLQAAIWPDLARRYERAPDRALRALHRPRWHYINLPLHAAGSVAVRRFPTPVRRLAECRADRSLNVVQALELCRCKLARESLPRTERALYLSWLFHLVGDLHQPLHAVSLHSERVLFRGDRGGNALKSEGAENLHGLWDRLPGRSGRRDRIGAGPAAATVRRLLAEPGLVEAGQQAVGTLDFAAWSEESRDLARAFVYTAPVLEAVRNTEALAPDAGSVDLPPLGADYLEPAAEVARRRIVEAGYRLAALLADSGAGVSAAQPPSLLPGACAVENRAGPEALGWGPAAEQSLARLRGASPSDPGRSRMNPTRP